MASSVGAAISFNQCLQSHPNIHATYLQLMRCFVNLELDPQTLVSELETLFKSHNDLLHGYRMFLPPEVQSTLPPLPPRQSRKKMSSVPDTTRLKPCIDFMNKVKKRFSNEHGVYLACLDAIKELSKGKVSYKEVYDAAAKIFGDKNQDLVDEFKLILGKKRINKEEDKVRKAEEKNATPKPSASPSSSSEENNSTRRQESMEDKMLTLDIRLSRVKATVESAKDLMQLLRDSPQQHQIINIDEYFSVLSLCCIRKEYKEQGFSIVKRLRENPKHVLPQLLLHLENKQEELEERREMLNKRWKESHQQKQKPLRILS